MSNRRRCFFDVTIDGDLAGRIVFELYDDIAPTTVENFVQLCTGGAGTGETTGKPLTYKGSFFHRVVKNFMIQGGDFERGDGTGGESIYGGTFEDESFTVKHDQPFILSMANRGPNTNGSQFFITTNAAPHLDGVHVAFGRVVSGQDVVTRIEQLKTNAKNRPVSDVVIASCGQLIKKKTADDIVSEEETVVKKSKKKKKKRESSESSVDSEKERPSKENASESEQHFSTVKPEDLPAVPDTNKFLLRRASPKKDEPPKRVERRARSPRRDRPKVKGRGRMLYRSPSKEGSITPPHWKREEERLIPMERLKDIQEKQKQREKEKSEEPRAADNYGFRDPPAFERPRNERREERSRHEKPPRLHRESDRHERREDRSRHEEPPRVRRESDRHERREERSRHEEATRVRREPDRNGDHSRRRSPAENARYGESFNRSGATGDRYRNDDERRVHRGRDDEEHGGARHQRDHDRPPRKDYSERNEHDDRRREYVDRDAGYRDVVAEREYRRNEQEESMRQYEERHKRQRRPSDIEREKYRKGDLADVDVTKTAALTTQQPHYEQAAAPQPAYTSMPSSTAAYSTAYTGNAYYPTHQQYMTAQQQQQLQYTHAHPQVSYQSGAPYVSDPAALAAAAAAYAKSTVTSVPSGHYSTVPNNNDKPSNNLPDSYIVETESAIKPLEDTWDKDHGKRTKRVHEVVEHERANVQPPADPKPSSKRSPERRRRRSSERDHRRRRDSPSTKYRRTDRRSRSRDRDRRSHSRDRNRRRSRDASRGSPRRRHRSPERRRSRSGSRDRSRRSADRSRRRYSSSSSRSPSSSSPSSSSRSSSSSGDRRRRRSSS